MDTPELKKFEEMVEDEFGRLYIEIPKMHFRKEDAKIQVL
jgi:hypothetical protein